MITEFDKIPAQRPATPLLERIDTPDDLRQLSLAQLPQLVTELRHYLLYCVGQTGGHLGAGLGVVELTCALHYLLDTPRDHLIWDVGHQAYPHKILTGRREAMLTLRKATGPAPFPKRSESPYDCFGTGHSSTSISAALGMALADQVQGRHQQSVAVIGDGAMTAGMAYEALCHAAHTGANLLVILNDNAMSISPNSSGSNDYFRQREGIVPSPDAALFGAFNFIYEGPVDGNNLDELLPALRRLLAQSGPRFLHLKTRKGAGFAPAEADPVRYHAISKIEPPAIATSKQPRFCNIFGQWLCQIASTDTRTIGITPAMREGSDLVAFSQQYPARYFDVAIAEQHATTLAAGFACEGLKPVLAIYSTFLQRALDQAIHDIALQQLDVLLAIDRAGLVGEDGATHAGIFDIAMLRPLPGMVIMTPADGDELTAMLSLGYHHQGPAAVRYPRGAIPTPVTTSPTPLKLGQSRLIRQGQRVAILNFGPLLQSAWEASEQLDATLVDMRFVKPLDGKRIAALCTEHELLVTLEDHMQAGGAGSSVAEAMAQARLTTPLAILGVADQWIGHASREAQLAACGLDTTGIVRQIQSRLDDETRALSED